MYVYKECYLIGRNRHLVLFIIGCNVKFVIWNHFQSSNNSSSSLNHKKNEEASTNHAMLIDDASTGAAGYLTYSTSRTRRCIVMVPDDSRWRVALPHRPW